MAITRISGNQIATSTQAIITTLSFLNTSSIFKLPTGDTASRPTGVSPGTLRFNSQEDAAEIVLKLLNKKGIINVGGPSQKIFDFAKKDNPKIKKIYSNGSFPKKIDMNLNKLKKILKK